MTGAMFANLLGPRLSGWAWSWPTVRGYLALGIPYQGVNLLWVLRTSVIPVLVGLMLGPASVGRLQWAAMVGGFPLTGLILLQRLYVGSFARLQEHPLELARFVRHLLAATHGVVAPIAVVTLVLIDPIVRIVFGAAWLSAVPLFYVLWAGCLVIPTVEPLAGLLHALGRSREVFRATLAAVLATWILGVPLALMSGEMGAAVASLAVHAAGLLVWRRARRAVDVSVLKMRGAAMDGGGGGRRGGVAVARREPDCHDLAAAGVRRRRVGAVPGVPGRGRLLAVRSRPRGARALRVAPLAGVPRDGTMKADGGARHIGVDATCWMLKRGFGRHARCLLGALMEVDTRNRYTFFIDAPEVRAELPPGAGVRVVGASAPTIEAASARGHRRLRDVMAMSRALSSADLDVVFFPTLFSYVPTFGRARRFLMMHDATAEMYPTMALGGWKNQLLWRAKTAIGRRQADVLLTVSHYSRDTIERLVGVEKGRLHVVGEASARRVPGARSARRDARASKRGLRSRAAIGGVRRGLQPAQEPGRARAGVRPRRAASRPGRRDAVPGGGARAGDLRELSSGAGPADRGAGALLAAPSSPASSKTTISS